ncbi:MAG: proline--tRNA ligase, partial [Sulfuriferula sp.]
HEFHVLADSGEDAIAYCPDSDYAANVELAEAVAPSITMPAPSMEKSHVATPNQHSIEEVAAFLSVPATQLVKTLLVEHGDSVVALLVRGDHQLNEIKAAKLLGVDEIRFASDAVVREVTGCAPGSIGPVGLNIRIVADRSVAVMADFVCGANITGAHFIGLNFNRDLPLPEVADIRNAVAGDASPDGKGVLAMCRGIEVGHIFQLRTNYSAAMACQYLDEQGKSQTAEMGCYGIGVSRIVAAAIEQNSDARGMTLPAALAPFSLAIVPVGYQKSEQVREVADKLYAELTAAGVDVLLDDRNERPGVMFADMELIGVPHRIVIGERGLKEGMLEYQGRRDAAATAVSLADISSFIVQTLAK